MCHVGGGGGGERGVGLSCGGGGGGGERCRFVMWIELGSVRRDKALSHTHTQTDSRCKLTVSLSCWQVVRMVTWWPSMCNTCERGRGGERREGRGGRERGEGRGGRGGEGEREGRGEEGGREGDGRERRKVDASGSVRQDVVTH